MKTRIGILGLGGVGGYFGGLLAKAYFESDEIEIVFIARNETQKTVEANGLKIILDESEFVVYPKLVSNNPDEIGKLDYLICATKAYDIEESLLSVQKCIKKSTIILPLYNGVDATERIQALFPENEVLLGCVYIVSYIQSPGVIRKTGHFEKLFFGSLMTSVSKLNKLQSIFVNAGIQSELSDTIEETIWEKFIFVSPLASATSYLNQNIGEIINSESNRKFFVALLNEITMVAAVKGLAIPNDIILLTIQKLQKSPQDATSSMHRDILAANKSELGSLTEFVIKEAAKYEVETPTYQMIFDKLSANLNS